MPVLRLVKAATNQNFHCNNFIAGGGATGADQLMNALGGGAGGSANSLMSALGGILFF